MLTRCIACDGFGWQEADQFDPLDEQAAHAALECAWCGGVGYVYRTPEGYDQRIPPADLDRLTPELEALEAARLREMGYTGEAKKPWEQAIRTRKS